MRVRKLLVMMTAGLLTAVMLPGRASAAEFGDPAPVLLADSFDDGTLAGWEPVSGSWDAALDEEWNATVARTTGPGLLRTAGPGWADYAVTVDVRPTPGQTGAGVAVRVRPDGSHYRMVIRNDMVPALQYVSARGTVQTLDTLPALVTPPGWRSARLILAVRGSTLVGYTAGTGGALFARDVRLGGGPAALVSYGGPVDFDNVRVESYAAAQPDIRYPLRPPGADVVRVEPGYATIRVHPTIDDTGVTDYVVYRTYTTESSGVIATLPAAGTVRLPLDPIAPWMNFHVMARDAAGNESALSHWATVPQPPAFPRVPGDTERPGAPGLPTATPAPGGGWTISWAPATDNVGVVAYHLYLYSSSGGTARILKTTANSLTLGANSLPGSALVTAYDRSWNEMSTIMVQLP